MRASDRPGLLVVVQATGSDVPVTDVSIDLWSALRATEVVTCVRKPIECFDPEVTVSDAGRIAEATGEPFEAICRWSYPEPVAPALAARRLGDSAPLIGRLFADTHFHPATQVAIIEMTGGPATPISTDGDNIDLITGFDPDVVVLCARAGAGVLNSVGMAARLLTDWNLLVLLLDYDGSARHMEQFQWLEARHHVFIDTTSLAEHLVSMSAHAQRRG